MKAVRIHAHGGPDQMRFEDVELAPPAPDEVRVRHTAIALNFSDVNVRRGGFISVSGVVTFRNAEPIREAVRATPIERILVETDAPFLTPEPHRTVRPNEPRYVVHVADALAELWGRGQAEARELLAANAMRFFGLAT